MSTTMKVAAQCSVPQQTERLPANLKQNPSVEEKHSTPVFAHCGPYLHGSPRRYPPRCVLSRLPPRSRPFLKGPPGRGLYRRGLLAAAVTAERRPLLGRRVLPALGPTSLTSARKRQGRGVWGRGRARPQAPRATSRPRRGNGCEPRPPPAYRRREGPERVGSGAGNAPVLAPDLGPSDRTGGT